MLPEFALTHRVAVVTGGARGLGLEMMRALAEAGADVACVDLLQDLARDAAEQTARDFGVRAASWRLDVTKPEEVKATFEAIEQDFGHIDVLVAAAGIVEHAPAEAVTAESWRRVIDVNLSGVFFCAQAAAQGMLQRGSGNIVLIASMSGAIVNYPQRQASYNVSKAGVIMLAKSLATEWARRGVRVNALSPGYMRTALTDQVLRGQDELRQTWDRLTPMGRMGMPSELRGAVIYLASDASSFMTGHSLVIDGGYTAW
jgi:sorbose reductase